MDKQEELASTIQQMFQKANRSIAAAKRHAQEGDYDFASSRAYYAVFYAMQATLLTKELTFSKHSSVISLFNQHFVKTGVFPKEFGRFISRLFRERQAGDYVFDLSISGADAALDIQIAENMLQTIGTYLSGRGFLPSTEERQ
ncbi:MAG TPA: HEPN domain-containing protein [Chloroflexi bacterium]|nr:HEPN domain-containing protein [Chloroflexota bacterium]